MRHEAAPTDTPSFSICSVRPPRPPEYAIHEEDRLEWLHALLSDTASLPDWLDYQLKHQPMLFIGCEIPDWIGRFLLADVQRLPAVDGTRFAVLPSRFLPASQVPSLSDFFATYCPGTLVQQLEMEPTAFVAQLRARWEEQNPVRPRAAAGTGPRVRRSSGRQRSSSATCARMRMLPGGCATRSPDLAETCGWTSDG